VTGEREFRVLAINAGSSSLKSAVYRLARDETLELSARIERIGQTKGSFVIRDGSGRTLHSEDVRIADHGAAIEKLLEWVDKHYARP
jgi:acetate kinase